jgi:hypothetical protein
LLSPADGFGFLTAMGWEPELRLMPLLDWLRSR